MIGCLGRMDWIGRGGVWNVGKLRSVSCVGRLFPETVWANWRRGSSILHLRSFLSSINSPPDFRHPSFVSIPTPTPYASIPGQSSESSMPLHSSASSRWLARWLLSRVAAT